MKRKLEETPTRKLKRARPSSKCPITKLTPTTRKKRIRAGSKMRTHYANRAKDLSELLAKKDMVLVDEQSSQMSNIINIVKDDYSEVVNTVINESTIIEIERQAMRNIWRRDCAKKRAKDKADFEADQKKNTSSNCSNRWSLITYRMALAVFARSPAAYRALQCFELLQLPSVYSLRNATQKYNSESGISCEYLEQLQNQYEMLREEKRHLGEKVPVGKGVLIFDGVKVIDKLLWNSKTHKFVGVAMDETEFAYITDIFKSSKSTEPHGAKYVLQFLWRDLSAKFDVIGPYFMSEKSINHGFLTGCLYETMRVLHAYGFRTRV